MAAIDGQISDPESRFKQLAKLADNVEVDKNIPPIRYFRSGVEMERMADVYVDEGNTEAAFVLYMKYIVLFVEKLPKHPQYKQANQVQVKRALDSVKKIFPVTEKLRAAIKQKYADEYKEWKDQENRKIKEENEQRRKKEKEEKQKQKAAEERQQQLQQLAAQQRNQTEFVSPVPSIPTPTAPHIEEDYPTTPKIKETVNDQSNIPDVPPPAYSPPSNDYYKTEQISMVDVERQTNEDQRYSEIKPSPTPLVDRTTKPSSIFDRQISTPVNGLRRIYIPQELISRFLSLASNNTHRNLETCGILTGKLSKNLFHITHLVIPKQTATPDSCTTTNEEEMFDVQDKHDLVTLGWIHTHPSQTSFLSSVDLHTHYAYQMLMPEAIAIVCAPKYNQVGVYRLTTNHGMSFIGSCSKPGFHPHPKEPPLFEDSEHVEMDTKMNLRILDLR